MELLREFSERVGFRPYLIFQLYVQHVCLLVGVRDDEVDIVHRWKIQISLPFGCPQLSSHPGVQSNSQKESLAPAEAAIDYQIDLRIWHGFETDAYPAKVPHTMPLSSWLVLGASFDRVFRTCSPRRSVVSKKKPIEATDWGTVPQGQCFVLGLDMIGRSPAVSPRVTMRISVVLDAKEGGATVAGDAPASNAGTREQEETM